MDVILIMRADFRLEGSPRESQTLFSHADADARFGASVFWLREGLLPDEAMKEFLLVWQTKRDGTLRGILEDHMIRNDQELATTRDRVASLERLLEDLRGTTRPEEWPALSSGYRLEIERMQGEVLDYLVRASPGAKRTTTA